MKKSLTGMKFTSKLRRWFFPQIFNWGKIYLPTETVVFSSKDLKSTTMIPKGEYNVEQIAPLDNTFTWYQIIDEDLFFAINHNLIPKEKFFIKKPLRWRRGFLSLINELV